MQPPRSGLCPGIIRRSLFALSSLSLLSLVSNLASCLSASLSLVQARTEHERAEIDAKNKSSSSGSGGVGTGALGEAFGVFREHMRGGGGGTETKKERTGGAGKGKGEGDGATFYRYGLAQPEYSGKMSVLVSLLREIKVTTTTAGEEEGGKGKGVGKGTGKGTGKGKGKTGGARGTDMSSRPDRVVVVSNYTSTLDAMEVVCRREKWGFLRLGKQAFLHLYHI